MKSGPFIDLVADTLGVEKGTTKVVARALREAGWLTTGPRGVNAPDMVPQDAARMIIALMTGAPPSRALQRFETFRSFKISGSRNRAHLQEILATKKVCTLDEFLTRYLEILISGQIHFLAGPHSSIPEFSLSINETAHLATIEMPRGWFKFVDVETSGDSRENSLSLRANERRSRLDLNFPDRKIVPGIQTTRTLTIMEVIVIANEFARDVPRQDNGVGGDDG